MQGDGSGDLRGDHAGRARPRVHPRGGGRRRRCEPHKLAVLEMSGRPGWWRVWVDGQAVTDPVRLRGSSAAGRRSRRPRAGTAARRPATVRLPLRARLGLVRRRRLVAAVRAGRRFLDGGERAPRPRGGARPSGVYDRTPRERADVVPYAFVARPTARLADDLDRRPERDAVAQEPMSSLWRRTQPCETACPRSSARASRGRRRSRRPASPSASSRRSSRTRSRRGSPSPGRSPDRTSP